MAVIEATDIAGNGEARLLPEFIKSTRLKGLLKSLLVTSQPTEDTLLDVMNKTGIDTAEGDQLDVIGKLLTLPRGGKVDTEYRARLYSKIALNSAKATPESIINLTRVVTGSQDVNLSEVAPAEVHVNVVGGREAQDDFLDLVSPIGVDSYLSTVPEGKTYWLVSEEGSEGPQSVLPEEGEESDIVIAEETN
jgi:hypothetical protein